MHPNGTIFTGVLMACLAASAAFGQPILPEAQARKEKSEAQLSAQKVPVNKHLPAIETEATAKFRTQEEVCLRALSLILVAAKAEGLEKKDIERVVKDYGLQAGLSPDEKKFLAEKEPGEQDKVNFLWRYESAWALMWALGYVSDLERPDKICDVPALVKTMMSRTRNAFLSGAKLRKKSEILDQADLIYRYHWAVTSFRIKGKEPPAGLEAGVVYERHYALNWLIRYMDQAWDDVSTDT